MLGIGVKRAIYQSGCELSIVRKRGGGPGVTHQLESIARRDIPYISVTCCLETAAFTPTVVAGTRRVVYRSDITNGKIAAGN
jgi:hypothetical protein